MAEALTAEQRGLVESCTGLMYQVARRWWKRAGKAGLRVDSDEFVAVCYEAICRAAQTFDPGRGFKFTTYSSSCMHFRCVEHADFLRARRKGSRNIAAMKRSRGLEAGPPERMSFGLSKLVYTTADHGSGQDDWIDKEDARERAAMVMDRLDDRTRGAVMLRALGKKLSIVGEGMGVTRERARQVCGGPGRSGFLKSLAGVE